MSRVRRRRCQKRREDFGLVQGAVLFLGVGGGLSLSSTF